MAQPAIALDTRQGQLDALLEQVCQALQLTPTQYLDAKKHQDLHELTPVRLCSGRLFRGNRMIGRISGNLCKTLSADLQNSLAVRFKEPEQACFWRARRYSQKGGTWS